MGRKAHGKPDGAGQQPSRRSHTTRPCTSPSKPSLAVVGVACAVVVLGIAWWAAARGADSTESKRLSFETHGNTPEFVTLPGLFSPRECHEIVALTSQYYHLQEGRLGSTSSDQAAKDTSFRRSKFAGIDRKQPNLRWVYERVLQAVSEVNAETWHFSLPESVDDDRIENIQFSVYDHNERGFYTWHLDQGRHGNTALRQLSVTVQLSSNQSYAGGEFEIYYDRIPRGGQEERDIQNNPESSEFVQGKPPIRPSTGQGTAVVFLSNLWHRVAPVTRGRRYSLVQWIQGR